MDHPDVFAAPCEYDDSDPADYRSGVANVGREAGGHEMVVKVYEVAPGHAVCPYHYEFVEEWLVVLTGAVTLRGPEGEELLATGALVCFPAGPEGAHKVSNPGRAPARIMMFSSSREPSVAVYPDSDKIGVWPGRDEDSVMLRRADGRRDYYDGEV